MSLCQETVWCCRSPPGPRGTQSDDLPHAPAKISAAYAPGAAAATLRSLLHAAELDRGRFQSPAWNPLAELIPAGSNVVIKPNWVAHANYSGAGLDCLVTHPSVLEAVLEYVARTQPASVIVGDAPIQGCDFGQLAAACGFRSLEQRWTPRISQFSIRDFRQTALLGGKLGGVRQQSPRRGADFILFDLAHDSALEPISADAERFRVTMYDPDALRRTHARGKHQYLVAREVMEADVVVNLPKLKTHKKAGITGALKNFVGVNGLKDYLPHHRKGGSLDGGDCYEGRSRLKRLAEGALDAANRAGQGQAAKSRAALARLAMLGGRLCGHDANMDGSWHGNDTVWRTTLDLQRIVHYGRLDGRLAPTPQRRVITITDAIVAGEGEGPLAPTPVPLGLMTFGLNTAAVEWVHALVMGFDPLRIPLVREAFRPHRYPLADFKPDKMGVVVDGERFELRNLAPLLGRSFQPPRGWRGHCELSHSPQEFLRCSA